MTTSIVVKANHGWPVKVTKLDPKSGAPLEFLTEMVEANTERTVYCHNSQDLLIHEVQPDEAPRGLSFGDALALLKSGKRVAREGWNGKGMFLVLVPGSSGLTVEEGRPLAKAGVPIGTTFNYLPHIDMWTAQGDFVPWLASQSDLLSNDWVLVAPDNV